MTNILKALTNIVENPVIDLISHYNGSNRANNMGDALETYVKDIFCNSLEENNQEKDRLYSQNFSYLGNTNNPPDIILKNGDAVEVKKIESMGSALALNSSYPKNKLFADDSRITDECKNCDNGTWEQKDIIYVVGVALKGTKKLKALWFVYGDCYAAKPEIYKKISDKISESVKEIEDIEFTKTNELAKIKKVDPLGITDLRVRGMWHIENPIKVFEDITTVNPDDDFTVNALMLEEKYNSFPDEERQKFEAIEKEELTIEDVEIKSPNNPAELLKAKLIKFIK